MKNKVLISHIAVCFLLFSSSSWAALDLSEIGMGARPLGLGRAYVALADDASAIFTNPAGLSRNNDLNLISMSGQMLGDVGYLLVGASDYSPIMGKFGIGYLSTSVGEIPLTRLTGSGSTLEVVQYDTTSYASSILFLSYGSKLSRFLRGVGESVNLGASLKYFLQGFSGGGTVMQDAVGAGMDADLGFQWQVNSWMNLGLTLQNFLSESMGGKFIWQKNSVTEGIPMMVKIGGHFKILGLSALKLHTEEKLDLLVEYEKNNDQSRPALWHLGLEYWPIEDFVCRFGIDQKARATEAGVGIDNNLTFGLGLYFAGFTFDYAYHQFGELSENSAHFFSLGYRGKEKGKEYARMKAERKVSTIPTPEVVVKPKLKKFSDVPDGYWAQKPIEYLATLGIMDGYQDGTFRPTKEITRGELAVILVKAKGFAIGQVKLKFRDVPAQSYEEPYISMAVERGYITGYPDGTFRPQERITRAEAATILAKFSGLYLKSKVSKKVFPDLPLDHWASPAVAATKEVGLFAYLSGKSFGPNLYLTRAEAAEIISKTPLVKEKIKELLREL